MKTPVPNLYVAASDPVAASKDADWIQLIPSGTFTARDGRGPFHTGDRAAMDVIVSATRARLGATEMMVDYDHQVLSAKESGGTAKAAGWIKDFEVRDDGIYGRVEWTDAASAAIEAKEYRYLSPLFLADKRGQVRRIANVALVNIPALDLKAVAAGAQIFQAKGQIMDDILEALGLAEGVSEADAVSAIQAMQAGVSAIAVAAGCETDADLETVAAAVKIAATSEVPDPAKYVPIEQVTALQSDLSALRESVMGDKAEELVAAAIQSGKLAPALKDWGLQLAKTDLAKFQAFTASAPVLTGAQLGNFSKTESDPDLDATDLQVMSQMGLSREEMIASKKDLSA